MPLRLAALVLLLALAVCGVARAAPGESPQPIANPDLVTACGIDIHVILDESGSVSTSAGDVRRAFSAFTSALKNTGSRMAVSEFSTVARLPLPGAAARNYTTVTDATIASTFNPYISTGYTPNGSTNWEDAFRMARYFVPRPGEQPHLVVFITDGDPNRVINENTVTYSPGNPNVAQNEYELKVPLSETNETVSDSENDAKDRAVPNANAVKAQGSHILTVAVGSALNNGASLSRIVAVSGPDVYRGTGTFDISTDDVYAVSDFSKLEAALREAAFQLCAPSITVRKLVDLTPSPGPDDRLPGEDWAMTATASPTPASWVLPAGATGNTATTTTGADGFASFQWNTTTPTASNFTIAETVKPGFENVPGLTHCSFQTPDQGDTTLPVTTTSGGFSASVPDDAIVTCEMTNRVLPAPGISIEKSTNGADADAPPGPFVPIGGAVTWSYLVTNTGNTNLSGIAVSDNQGVTVTCPGATLLPGESFTCTAAGVALATPYANVGTVNAVDSFGTAVSDTDPSHYTGAAAGIDVEKATNGDDADDAPGPFIAVGDPVTWTYTIRNTGTTTLTGVTLADDRLGPAFTCGTTTLPPNGTTQCTRSGTAVAGQYENVATATGVDGLGQIARDSDPSHYFGEDASVDIEKATNGEDADQPPGPPISAGDPVRWTYRVTNTGNVPLIAWAVSDNKLGSALACPRLLQLAPGQTIVCRGTGVAQAGQYDNVGTVVGTAPSLATVTDSDPSHYFGVQGDIDLEKHTNGVDADEAPGPLIPVGAPVTWTYEVTNNGNSPLTGVHVVDLQNVGVTCPKTDLAIAETMTCTASGVAEAGQYRNLAIARGLTAASLPVSDTDPSHYFGATTGVEIEKSTNGVDADLAPGPLIPAGDRVTWSYLVTNTGNGALTGVTVTDDKGVTVTCPDTTLTAGATMTCTASGTAAAGQYENTGSVSARDALGAIVSDSDPSHYFGAVSQIRVKKATNGDDSDLPTGPQIPGGNPVTWTYAVTNPGNVHVFDVRLADDDPAVTPRFVGGDTDGDGALDPGETWDYTASGTAVAGQYVNTATVTGLDRLETPVSSADPAHYISPNPIAPLPPPLPATPVAPKPSLELTKLAQTRRVRGGKVVRFRLRVTNTGAATARGVRVCDRLPGGLVWRSTGSARVDGRRACFSVRSLGPHRSRTFRVTTYASLTQHSRTICNVATRTASGVRPRSARACIRVLPSREGCPARAARTPAPGRSPAPSARAAC